MLILTTSRVNEMKEHRAERFAMVLPMGKGIGACPKCDGAVRVYRYGWGGCIGCGTRYEIELIAVLKEASPPK